MRFYFTILILLTSLSIQAACDKKVDPSKVIVFIDNNWSDREIEYAEKAACERGEKMIVIPENYKKHSPYIQKIADSKNKYDNCLDKNLGNPKACDPLFNSFAKAESDYNSFKGHQKSIPILTKETFQKIKDENAKIQSIVISGHNGGGSYSGKKSSFTRIDFDNAIKDFPEINEIKSLLLLGCYTSVPGQVIDWKKSLPDVKLISGYGAIGPEARTNLGWKQLYNLLSKEKELFKQADTAQLNKYWKDNFSSVSNLLDDATYISCEQAHEDFYAESRAPFSPFDTKFCEKNATQIKAMIERVSLYQRGELEPPLDTRNGELRQLYSLARKAEHCKEILPQGFKVDTVFNLLFFEDVKESFAKFYEEDLMEAEKTLSSLTLESVERTLNERIKSAEELLNKEIKNSQLLETNIEEYKRLQEKEMEPLKQALDELGKKHPFLKDIPRDQHFSPSWMTPDQRGIFSQYQLTLSTVRNQKKKLASDLSDPKKAIESCKKEIQFLEQGIKERKMELIEYQKNPEKLKAAWIPTKKNLAEKTRKEILQNIHNLNGLLSNDFLNHEQRKVVSWTNTVMSRHLDAVHNPASWHEFASRVEAPLQVDRLRNFSVDNTSYSGGSTTGGMSSVGSGGALTPVNDSPALQDFRQQMENALQGPDSAEEP